MKEVCAEKIKDYDDSLESTQYTRFQLFLLSRMCLSTQVYRSKEEWHNFPVKDPYAIIS